MTMATAAPFPAFCCCSQRRPALHSSSPLMVLDPRSSRSHLHRSIPQLGLDLDSPWSGLKHLGISSRQNYRPKEKKGNCRGVVYASLFGVGAPEALVIGVVALLVFGPKGLAEVARNLGKTLRAFQPTIRELQEVSREFKSTLEREIGLDEVASSTDNTYRSTSSVKENQQAVVDPNGIPTTEPLTSEGLLKTTEEQLAASAIRPQTDTSNPEEQPQVPSTTPEAAAATPTSASPEAAAQKPSSKKAENERE